MRKSISLLLFCGTLACANPSLKPPSAAQTEFESKLKQLSDETQVTGKVCDAAAEELQKIPLDWTTGASPFKSRTDFDRAKTMVLNYPKTSPAFFKMNALMIDFQRPEGAGYNILPFTKVKNCSPFTHYAYIKAIVYSSPSLKISAAEKRQIGNAVLAHMKYEASGPTPFVNLLTAQATLILLIEGDFVQVDNAHLFGAIYPLEEQAKAIKKGVNTRGEESILWMNSLNSEKDYNEATPEVRSKLDRFFVQELQDSEKIRVPLNRILKRLNTG